MTASAKGCRFSASKAAECGQGNRLQRARQASRDSDNRQESGLSRRRDKRREDK